MNWYFRRGIVLNGILAALIYAALFLLDAPVIRIFNRDADLVRTACEALPIFSLSFLPMALNLIYTAFFFSTKQTRRADLLAVSRGVVLKALLIFCIPLLFGVDFIWIAPFAAEMLTLILAVFLRRKAE